ncbi:MAG: UDP-N-acetylmuramate--L-alanine ligase [Planctomycetes bacterium]|nr:UDP-N-acetylmuramate--L-alanine ligase [Planctomycetota bacterium]
MTAAQTPPRQKTMDAAAPSTRPATPDLAGKHLHFVGIGGCGMSGLARIARKSGALCTGSDMSASPTVLSLQREGFEVATEQTARSVPGACDILVISAAIKADHPEVLEAQRRGVTVLKYAQMLGRLMIGRTGVAVSGTHGKSSTTSMLSHILIECGLDPSFIVGATCRQIGGGSRTGASEVLVAEACEFDRSFHSFYPTLSVILNVEEDHMEIYGTLDAVVESFRVFAQRLPDAAQGGFLLINHDMPHRLTITAGLNCAIETIGLSSQADWHVELGRQRAADRIPGIADALSNAPVVRLYHKDELVARWVSPMPGEHMAYNAAAAAILANRLGAKWEEIAAALARFQGLDRRMQLLGKRKVGRGFVTVVDDYGHHPTEVDTTLRALRRHYKPHRLICVFQPHQHSRTRFLMEQFAQSFSEADITIVPDIYFVRDSEKERHAVSAGDLVDRIRQRGKQAMHLYPFDAIVEQLQVIARPGDLVVSMGAGDVHKIAEAFLAL